MSNKFFKIAIGIISLAFLALFLLAVAEERLVFVALFGFATFGLMACFFSLNWNEPKVEIDPYAEAVKKQQEEKTKDFIIKARRNGLKVIKGGKNGPKL